MTIEEFQKELLFFDAVFESEELIILLDLQTLTIYLDMEDEYVPVESEHYRNVKIAQSKIKYYLQKIKEDKIFAEEEMDKVINSLKLETTEIRNIRS